MKNTEQLSTSPHKSKQLITIIINSLSELDESLSDRITQYILYGDGLDVLTDFDELCQIPDNANKIYQLLRRPYGYYTLWYDECGLKTHASTQGRIDFYKLLTDVYTPEQIIRFDRFFAILCEHLGFIKHIDKQIPSWFIYLLYDGLLITIFNPLSELDKSLPERITQYILHGDELDVLDDFDKLCQISDNANDVYDLLRRPSDYYSTWDEFEPKTHPSVKARIDFYQSWMRAYTPEQIIRFARISAILYDHLGFIKHISKQIPSWFIYLLYDGLITQLPPYCDQYCKNEICYRENWSIHQLHQLLEIEQEGLGDKLLFAIFDRKYITFIAVERYRFFGYFTQLDGLLTYIQERIELFKQLPTLGLAPLGQIEQLKYIQRYPKLQLQLVDFIAMQALNSFKQVSQLAIEMLFNLPHELIQPQLQHFLTSGAAKERAHAAILLSRIILEPTILLQALANETNKTVIATIKIALLKLETSNTVKQQANLIIPDFEPLVDTPLPITARDILQQNFDEHLIECKKLMENELERNRENNTSWDYEKKRYKLLQTVTSKSLDIIFDYLNGKIDYLTLFKKLDKKIDFSFLATKDRLSNLSEFSLYHLFRMTLLIEDRHDYYYFQNVYTKYDIVKNFDLRQVADVLLKINIIPDVKYKIARVFLSSDYFHNIYENEPYKLWAFFAENEFLIDEALGLAPQQTSYFINKAYPIKILQMFSTIPAKYVAYLFELALNESKYTQEQLYFILRQIRDIDNQVRYAAQDALRQLPNIHIQVEQALSSPKQKVRIAAANWLAELGQKSSINALNAALKNEKCKTVQAAILVALEKMGEDISQHLTPKKLLADAQQGLKGKIPAGLDWFDFNLIPTLTWQNGDKVDSLIIEWWICLAFKLKDPINPLLTIYNRLLSTQSQQQLGEFILQSFIKQDTRTPTLEEAEAKASAEADKRLQQRILSYQCYPEFYSDYKDIT
ncbi:HEAT repeat domain-containing protein, partial [Gilliamella apicola]|uniref:HEAT repeat domain-containing protein n=1 Tax=Gilliamella apicola TaxID=1196095 RepID=UPI0039889549